MERFTISKSEKQTIYEIYRACRLCGAGGGYRMPIIQNIIDLESSDVELRQKIQECLQLEVHQDDRMPPLICELCVDKVNDFYNFFTLTRQTNVRTRTRLGLPLQTAKKGEAEPNDCILGVTEPVYVKDDEPPAKKSKAGPKCSKNIKKEPEVEKIKIENTSDSSRSSSVSSRSGRGGRPPPPAATPPAATPPVAAPPPRRARVPPAPASRKSAGKPEPPKPTPTAKDKKERKSEIQNLIDNNMKFEDTSLLAPRVLKRAREEPPRPALLPKRTNRAPPPKEPVKEPTPPPPSPRSKPGPKSKKKPEPKAPEPKVPEEKTVLQKVARARAKAETPDKIKETPRPPAETPSKGPFKCAICDAQLKTVQAHTNHLKCHTACYTKPANACNPCGKWFVTTEEAATHHRYHRADTFPYHCRRCFEDFGTLQLYNDHISDGRCSRGSEPELQCARCWGRFAGEALRAHRCPGASGRPGGKCSNCPRTYATVRTLRKHERSCTQKRSRDLIADPDVLRRLKPMQVRIRRCDDLIAHGQGDQYDVSNVKPNYGLAKNYVYPYLKFSPVKNENLHRDSMLAIPVALNEEIATDYTNWDSDDSDTDTIIRRVPTLFTLAVKKLFSKHCLGKVPKRRKRVKSEAFENDDFTVSSDINDIINSLGNDLGNCRLDKKDLTARIKDIIGCLDDSDMDGGENVVRNDDDDKNADESKDGDDANDSGENKNESTTENLIQSNDSKDGSDTICNGELNDSGENKNESAKENLIQSNENQDGNDEISNSELNDSDENKNQSTKENLIQSNESQDGNDEICELNDSAENKNESTTETLIQSNESQDGNYEICNSELNDSDENKNQSTKENLIQSNESQDGNDEICELNDSAENKNESTTETLIQSNESRDGSDEICNSELNDSDENKNESMTENLIQSNKCFSDEASSAGNSCSVEISDKVIQDNDSNRIDEENKNLNRSPSETDNQSNLIDDNEKSDLNFKKSIDNEEEMVAESKESENMSVNVITESRKENSFENESRSNYCNEEKKTEETSKQVNKESPIKHSIENLIGDSNSDKYISEVISNIEAISSIINKTPRNEENGTHEQVNGQTEINAMDNSNVMDVFEENIGEDREKRMSDNDKITLEDLLPKEDTRMELDNISDEDFDFDA